MLNAGYSWRFFFWICLAFASALLVAAFVFVEETTYKRSVVIQLPEGEYIKEGVAQEEIEAAVPRSRKSWMKQLSLWNGVNHNVSYWIMTVRPFTYLLVPAVFWVIATYGIVRLFTETLLMSVHWIGCVNIQLYLSIDYHRTPL